MTAGDPTVAMEIIDIRQLHSPQNKHTQHTHIHFRLIMRLPARVTIAHEGPWALLLLTGLLFTAGLECFIRVLLLKGERLDSSALLCHCRLGRVFLCLTILHNKLKGCISEKPALVTIHLKIHFFINYYFLNN